MNSIIPFKKSIIFKTTVSKITDISLTHDYKIIDNMIEGNFNLNGTYKMTEASLINEEFYYDIPFSIAISDRIDKDTINLKIEDFNYNIDSDTMLININLKLEAEEKEERNIIDDINEFTANIKEKIMPTEEEKENTDEFEENNIITKEENIDIEDNSVVNNLISNVNNNDSFITYKVHIFRDGDTIQSISDKYNISIDSLKEYNDIDNINIGDKILVPFIYNE